jgi:hypothetical protein
MGSGDRRCLCYHTDGSDEGINALSISLLDVLLNFSGFETGKKIAAFWQLKRGFFVAC